MAPTGWPFAFSPPLVLTGTLATEHRAPDSSHFPAARRVAEAEVLVRDELGDREAVVHLGEVDVLGVRCRPCVNACRAASTVAGKEVKLRFQLLISGSVASPVPRK